MKFLNKLERKYYRYAIPNLTLVIIICFAIGYILSFAAPDFYMNLTFVPYLVVRQHQYWRLFTWIFTTPSSFNIFTLIMLLFYYSIGRRLEMTWGKFMYNLYIFGGMFLETLFLLVVSLFYYVWSPNAAANALNADHFVNSTVAGMYVTYFMTMSMFLAFAAIYSDTVVLLYFILPIKIKWLAYLDLIYLVYEFVVGNLFLRTVILASVLNFFIFFLMNRKRNMRTLKDRKRQREFQRKVREAQTGRMARDDGTGNVRKMNPISNGNPPGITMHKCAICGRTELDSDDLEFRFCSKCNGNYEYCNEHLFTHEHVK